MADKKIAESKEDVYNFNEDFEDKGNLNVSQNGRFRNKTVQDEDPVNHGHACGNCSRIFNTNRGLKRHLLACGIAVKQETENIGDGFELNVVQGNGDVECNSADHNVQNIIFKALDTHVDCNETNDDLENLRPLHMTYELSGEEIKSSCLIEEGKCDCCGDDIQTAHLVIICRWTEKKVGDIQCNDCNLFFKSRQAFTRHRIMSHDEGQETFQCDKCPARCPDKKTMTKHARSHKEISIECPTCKQVFSRSYHLVRHNLQTGCDGTPVQSFVCQVCQRAFSRKDNLREHLRAHAGQTKRKKMFICEYCHMPCTGMSMLNEHRKIHTGSKPHKCDVCNQRFTTSGAMKKHRRKHTGERPYECKECQATFAAKETLNRHMRIHTGNKPHVCVFCAKRFIQASQLRAHMFHHTGENGFHCETCGQAFNRKTRLDMHVKYVHEGAKPYICSDCERTFIRREDMMRHQILHSGVRSHECSICKKSFAMKASLKTHLLIHRKEPPCSCDECGRAFIRQDCLLRHMRSKHRDKLEEIMAEAEKKKLQAQLLAVAAASASAENEEPGTSNSDLPSYMSDDALTEAVSQLLDILVDEVTMKSFGWPKSSVDKVLESVIRRCGHIPNTSKDLNYADCLRENTKLLFTVVIDDSAVRTLLNNQTVDEVILHVLKLAKT